MSLTTCRARGHVGADAPGDLAELDTIDDVIAILEHEDIDKANPNSGPGYYRRMLLPSSQGPLSRGVGAAASPASGGGDGAEELAPREDFGPAVEGNTKGRNPHFAARWKLEGDLFKLYLTSYRG